MSKYLIGLIPSIFILIIACFAKATPVPQHPVLDTGTQYFKMMEPGKALLNHKKTVTIQSTSSSPVQGLPYSPTIMADPERTKLKHSEQLHFQLTRCFLRIR